jgi:alkylated DNA repair dioxygenase AlkB
MPTLDVRYLPRFASDPAALFARAQRELVWDQRMAARQTASVGLAYNYSGNVYPDTPMPGFLRVLADQIAELVAHPITNCLANLYVDGAARMGFHSDSAKGIAPGTTTSILSLGATRSLTFRSTDPARHTETFSLEPGSLFVMAASVQDAWKHGLLPVPGAATRISLTFRHIVRARP